LSGAAVENEETEGDEVSGSTEDDVLGMETSSDGDSEEKGEINKIWEDEFPFQPSNSIIAILSPNESLLIIEINHENSNGSFPPSWFGTKLLLRSRDIPKQCWDVMIKRNISITPVIAVIWEGEGTGPAADDQNNEQAKTNFPVETLREKCKAAINNAIITPIHILSPNDSLVIIEINNGSSNGTAPPDWFGAKILLRKTVVGGESLDVSGLVWNKAWENIKLSIYSFMARLDIFGWWWHNGQEMKSAED